MIICNHGKTLALWGMLPDIALVWVMFLVAICCVLEPKISRVVLGAVDHGSMGGTAVDWLGDSLSRSSDAALLDWYCGRE